MHELMNYIKLSEGWQSIDICTAESLYRLAIANGASTDVALSAMMIGLVLQHCHSEGHVCINAKDAGHFLAQNLGKIVAKLERTDNGTKIDVIKYFKGCFANYEQVLAGQDDDYQLKDDSVIATPLIRLENKTVREALVKAKVLQIIDDDEPATNVTITAPLIYSLQSFYISRSFGNEIYIADMIQHRQSSGIVHQDSICQIAEILSTFFPTPQDGSVDWQKIAVANSLSNNISVITGGPGTGKTTSVAKLAAILSVLKERPLALALAAPTGKAADRMRKSFLRSLGTLDALIKQFPNGEEIYNSLHQVQASTIHSLIKVQPGHSHTKFNQHNKLSLDLLVVDEASMIDLGLMYKTLRAIDLSKTSLVLLGDKDQLSSVEAGAVLGDICSIFNQKHEKLNGKYLEQILQNISLIVHLTGISVQSMLDSFASLKGQENVQHKIFLVPGISALLRSYRFNTECGIGLLASCINAGNSTLLANCLQQFSTTNLAQVTENNKLQDDNQQYSAKIVDFYQVKFATEHKPYDRLKLENVLMNNYRGQAQQARHNYFAFLNQACLLPGLQVQDDNTVLQNLFELFNDFRILVPNNEGVIGVKGINAFLRSKALEYVKANFGKGQAHSAELVDNFDNNWFPGLPYLVTKNDAGLGIYNGDIGICHFDITNKASKRVWFENGKSIPLSLLTDIEPSYAMTIHKSQGSEFTHTMVIIPEGSKRLLSKELFYTAVTRAKTELTIYGDLQTLTSDFALAGVKRFSGLQQRIYDENLVAK